MSTKHTIGRSIGVALRPHRTRVALVVSAMNVGGMEWVVTSIYRHLRGSGMEPEIVETLEVGASSAEWARAGLVVRTIPMHWMTSEAAHARRVARRLSQYDMVILNDARHAHACLRLLSPSVRAICILHTDMPAMIRNACASIERVDRIIAVSPGVAQRAISVHRVPNGLMDVIPNGVSVPTEPPIRWPHGTMRIAFVGRILHSAKGVLYLPAIIRTLTSRHTDIEIEIVGSGPDLGRLKVEFQNRCPSVSVKFSGALSHEESLKVLSGADILLLPSLVEGLPIVLLEAMARGAIPIVTRLGGQTDIVVDDGRTGYLVEAGNTDGFAEAIIRVLSDASRAAEMRLNAWRRVRDAHSSERMNAAYVRAIECAVSARPPQMTVERSLDVELLGPLRRVPRFLVRPVRWTLRKLGWKGVPDLQNWRYGPPAAIGSPTSKAGGL